MAHSLVPTVIYRVRFRSALFVYGTQLHRSVRQWQPTSAMSFPWRCCGWRPNGGCTAALDTQTAGENGTTVEVCLPCKRHIGVVEKRHKNGIDHDFWPVLTPAIASLAMVGELTDADTSPECFAPHQTFIRCGAALRLGRITFAAFRSASSIPGCDYHRNPMMIDRTGIGISATLAGQAPAAA